MTRIGLIRLAVIAASIGALELACRLGLINHQTIIPPSEMASALWTLLASGVLNADIERTLGMIALVIALSIVLGFVAGIAIHALPRVREALDPFFATYYAVPIFIFYPVLIAIFGLSVMPIVLIGVATAIVAMIISTLNGLDRVPRVLTKVARVHRLARVKTAHDAAASGRGAVSVHRHQALGLLRLHRRSSPPNSFSRPPGSAATLPTPMRISTTGACTR